MLIFAAVVGILTLYSYITGESNDDWGHDLPVDGEIESSPKKPQESHDHDDEKKKKAPVSFFEKFIRKEREEKLLREQGIRY